MKSLVLIDIESELTLKDGTSDIFLSRNPIVIHFNMILLRLQLNATQNALGIMANVHTKLKPLLFRMPLILLLF